MATSVQARRARNRLDARLAGFQPVEQFVPPQVGWIRAIREALGMSLAEIGARMGVSAQTAQSTERSEQAGTIQLNTLRRAAAALDCTVAYILIPNTSLTGTMTAQAERVLARESRAAEHTMALEAQPATLGPSARRGMLDRLVESGRLWRVR